MLGYLRPESRIMDTRINYALVGLFVMVLGTAMVLFFIWLSGKAHNKIYNTYVVYAGGGVSGLNVQSPVEYNGVRIGYVDKILLEVHDPQLVKIMLKIEQGTPVTESTVATLIPQGITGLVYVGLKALKPYAPPLKAKPNQTYPIIPYQKPLLTQLSEIAPILTNNVRRITRSVEQLLSKENVKAFTVTLKNLEKLSQTLDSQSDHIRSSLTSLDTFLQNSANASRHFEGTVMATHQTMQNSDVMIDNLRNQVVPSLQELLDRMNTTTLNLQKMSEDLQRNPSILIRGKQLPALGPGE